jgi:[acyl-carrier-protein] S-malonyltransferase
MKLAFLFPGQGSQRVGMGADLAREFTAAREVFDEANEALGFKLSRLCFEGPENELTLTVNTQPATLATSIAALRAFQTEFRAQPEVVAGHSLGEYTALVAAGALDLAAALRAVRERGRLMQEACPPGEGSMAALIGLDLDAVREICEQVSREGQVAVPANLNAPGQIVIAGHSSAVRQAIEIAKERGAKMSVELKVSAPFHSPLMRPARVGMEPIIAALQVRPLRVGVIANVTAEVNHDLGRVKPLLLEQITAPVRWEESMTLMEGSGATAALEFGAGRVLAGLMRRINKGFRVWPVEDPATLRAAGQAVAEEAA